MLPGSLSLWYMLHSTISQDSSFERLSMRALQITYRKLDLEGGKGHRLHGWYKMQAESQLGAYGDVSPNWSQCLPFSISKNVCRSVCSVDVCHRSKTVNTSTEAEKVKQRAIPCFWNAHSWLYSTNRNGGNYLLYTHPLRTYLVFSWQFNKLRTNSSNTCKGFVWNNIFQRCMSTCKLTLGLYLEISSSEIIMWSIYGVWHPHKKSRANKMV